MAAYSVGHHHWAAEIITRRFYGQSSPHRALPTPPAQPVPRATGKGTCASYQQERARFLNPRSASREEVVRMCTANLAGGPLTCVRPAGHHGGHVYHCHHGSWVADRHVAS